MQQRLVLDETEAPVSKVFEVKTKVLESFFKIADAGQRSAFVDRPMIYVKPNISSPGVTR